MLGYLANPRAGAYCYNVVHSYIAPIVLALVAIFFMPKLLPFALIWFNHIGMDRSFGYGLKYSAAFGLTHLKRLGKA
jgi:hypothetical protein